MDILSNIKWGGSGIERELYLFVVDLLEDGDTIVELGSGNVSTLVFGRPKYIIFSRYLQKVRTQSSFKRSKRE
jgi:hypothetical protein